MTADHRSAHPNFPGVPWWGAVLIAATATAIGFAFDAGSGGKELTAAFSACYVVGCVAAVLAVRQSAVFTAVIQPPLILFVSVPGAYWLFHGAKFTGIKDTLINCGYPLIERFPLMLFTSAGVLLVGMARWYLGTSARRAAPADAAAETKERGSGRFAALTSKMSALWAREPAEDDVDEAEAPRRRHTIERPTRATAKPAATGTARTTRAGRPVKRAAPSRSRHARPPAETEIIEAVVDRPRRPRPQRQSEPPPIPPPEPRRRPRTPSTREPRARKTPLPPEWRSAYERPERRSAYERPERRSRFEDNEPFEPPRNNGTNGGNGTHHPISRVRYRDTEDNEDHAEYRTRPRAPRHRHAESWEYDS